MLTGFRSQKQMQSEPKCLAWKSVPANYAAASIERYPPKCFIWRVWSSRNALLKFKSKDVNESTFM